MAKSDTKKTTRSQRPEDAGRRDFIVIATNAMFGLGAAGAAGLSDILDSFARDASSVMGLAGKTKIGDIDANCLAVAHGYSAGD